MHTLSHNMKKMARRTYVNVAFLASSSLSKLCKFIDASHKKEPKCNIWRKNTFARCIASVMYSVPSYWGKVYVRHTGRCLNSELSQKKENVESTRKASCLITMHGVSALWDSKGALLLKKIESMDRPTVEAALTNLASNSRLNPFIYLLCKEKVFRRMVQTIFSVLCQIYMFCLWQRKKTCAKSIGDDCQHQRIAVLFRKPTRCIKGTVRLTRCFS